MLTDIVFPEQARDYTIAVAQQTNAYRVSHYNIPDFLHDQPHLVQAECLANVQGQWLLYMCELVIKRTVMQM